METTVVLYPSEQEKCKSTDLKQCLEVLSTRPQSDEGLQSSLNLLLSLNLHYHAANSGRRISPQIEVQNAGGISLNHT